jgi:hypothetical protein
MISQTTVLMSCVGVGMILATSFHIGAAAPRWIKGIRSKNLLFLCRFKAQEGRV